MRITRRDFLRGLGQSAAAFATSWVFGGCRALPLPTPTNAPTPSPTLLLPAARLTVDAARIVGKCDPKLWANIGFDPMYSHTVSLMTQPVWDLIRETRAFRYIRCHNTFSDAAPNARPDQIMGCRVYTEDANGAARYNFQYLDRVLDTWTRAGLKPILEMDFMPDALAEGAVQRNYGGGAVNAPRDFSKWREMIYRTVVHLMDRYGVEEVRSWYLEIWNEPDLGTYFVDGATPPLPTKFTTERLTRFLKMYDYFVDGASAADEKVHVGGPGLAGQDDFLKIFLDHVANGTNFVTGKRGTRADFISWHVYGDSTRVMDVNKRRRALVKSYPALANAELQQNEWGQPLGMLAGSGDMPTVLSEYDAAYLCRAIDNIFSNSDAGVDLFLRWGQMVNGWRAMTRQYGAHVVPLAVFNAYTLLANLGPDRIMVENGRADANVRAFAARSGTNSVQMVVYRFEEKNLESSGNAEGVELSVRGLSGASLPLRIYRVDREHSNAYRAWLALGSPKNPSNAVAAEIAAQAAVTPEVGTVAVEAGVAKIRLEMTPNAMVLVLVGV